MKTFLPLFMLCLAIGLNAQDSLNMQKVGQLTYNDPLKDVWGWVDSNGKEFALVCLQSGFSIVDISTPSAPLQVHYIPGVNSDWRDVKTYSHFAYVVHDISWNSPPEGILIVDLNTVDSANTATTYFSPTITSGTDTIQYRTAHNIFIDENGVLYMFGTEIKRNGINTQGTLIFDLTADPESPSYLGMFDQHNLHDGMVRGDTLWGASGSDGYLLAIDVSDKSNPVILGNQTTPHAYMHNAWVSDNNKVVFTTDETKGAFITAFDVSDPFNITELDRIKTGLSSDVIPHNTHVHGDFLVNSYYSSGIQIVDATEPSAMIEVAYYDTSPLQGFGFNGAWGAYPWLPSGLILATDTQEGLFILSSSYPKGCYFSGQVIDAVTGIPLPNASLEVLNLNHQLDTDVYGEFNMTVRDSGTYQIITGKPGYTNDTTVIQLRSGVHTKDTIALLPVNFSISEKREQQIEISPNPAQDLFEIKLPQNFWGVVEVRIVDMKGSEVFSKILQINESTLKVHHQLESGVYLVFVQTSNEALIPAKLLVK